MKKILSIVLSFLIIFTFSACSNSESQSEVEDNISTENSQNNKILIAYFTHPERNGVDTVASASRVVVNDEIVGNTQLIASWIQQSIDGDLFTIETVERYPDDHDTLVDLVDEQQEANARPKLASHIENLADYDTIFIGYPIWWYDLPLPLYTFLEEYDLSGKTIIPFSTHGGSQFSSTIETIAEIQQNATVIDNGLSISRNNVSDARSDVTAWLEELGMLK